MTLMTLIIASSSIALVGLACGVYNLSVAVKDYHHLDIIRNDGFSKVLIVGVAVQESVRAAAQLLFVALNVQAYFGATTQELNSKHDFEPGTYIILGLEVFLMINSLVGSVTNVILKRIRDREGR